MALTRAASVPTTPFPRSPVSLPKFEDSAETHEATTAAKTEMEKNSKKRTPSSMLQKPAIPKKSASMGWYGQVRRKPNKAKSPTTDWGWASLLPLAATAAFTAASFWAGLGVAIGSHQVQAQQQVRSYADKARQVGGHVDGMRFENGVRPQVQR